MNSFDITGHRFLLLCLDDKSTINSTARNDYPPALPRALITHDNFIENILTKYFHLSNLLLFVFSIRGSRSNPKFFYTPFSVFSWRGNREAFLFLYTEHRSRCQRLYSRLVIFSITNRTYSIPLSATFFRSYKSRCLVEYCRNESAQTFLKVYIYTHTHTHRLHDYEERV